MHFYTIKGATRQNFLNNPIHNNIAKNKIPWNKSNQGGKRPILGKLQRHWWKKLKVTQTDGMIYRAHGLEELILFNDHTTQSNLQIQ